MSSHGQLGHVGLALLVAFRETDKTLDCNAVAFAIKAAKWMLSLIVRAKQVGTVLLPESPHCFQAQANAARCGQGSTPFPRADHEQGEPMLHWLLPCTSRDGGIVRAMLAAEVAKLVQQLGSVLRTLKQYPSRNAMQ